MRRAISGLLCLSLTTSAAFALAQPAPEPAPALAPATDPAARALPPPPPSPGVPSRLSEPPPPAPSILSQENPVIAPPDALVAGWNDGFYIMDAKDYFRLYPGAVVQLDFLSSFGPGVPDVPATSGGVGLTTRFIVRRAQLVLGGEFLKRWTFKVIAEFAGGSAIGNPDGKAELSAAPAGATATPETARYAPVQSPASAVAPLDVWINYRAAPWLNLMVGQFNVPFSMENRTLDPYTPWMERNLPIRSFVAPGSRDIGAMLWGNVGDGLLAYELGVFGGEGLNRPSVDSRLDFMGRIYVHPFAKGKSALAKNAQIGLSARHGDRDPKAVGYDYPAITTGHGFILWRPSYIDSLGRLTHILPSGSQDAIGGELRVRTHRLALQGELYYVNNNTREAIDGFQLTNTERFGRFQGVGWYAQLSGWPLGDPFVSPEPGKMPPKTMDLTQQGKGRLKRGLEVLGIAAGINASYQGATRLDSPADAKTPASKVTAYQFGLGAQYWHTKYARFAVNYNAYVTPGSGQSSDNQALVPDNLLKDSAGKTRTGSVLHELGARLNISF